MARGGINAVRIDAGRLLIHAGSFGQQLAAGLNANIARGEREAQMKPPVGPRGLGAMILGVCHAMRFSRVPRPKMERRSGLSLLRVEFDHFVGAGEERRWNVEAELPFVDQGPRRHPAVAD